MNREGWSLVWTERSIRDLDRRDPPTRERIVQAMERFARTGYGDVTRLTERGPELRLRVGPWRVRFVLEYETRAIRVRRVLPRGSAYDD